MSFRTEGEVSVRCPSCGELLRFVPEGVWLTVTEDYLSIQHVSSPPIPVRDGAE